MERLCANCDELIDGIAYGTKKGFVCESCEEKLWKAEFKEIPERFEYKD